MCTLKGSRISCVIYFTEETKTKDNEKKNWAKLLVEVHRTALGGSVPDNPELSESDLLLGMTPVPI